MNPSEIARVEEETEGTLASLREKIIVLREMAPDSVPGVARGPRVPPMSARKRRRRHVRDQRRANR